MRYPMISLLCLFCLAGCSGGPGGFQPVSQDTAVFWDRQTTETGALLREIAGDFNTTREGPPLRIERAGGYRDIYHKISAGIKARRLPSMAVAYESMTAEYAATGAAVALGPFINHPELGYTEAELDDFFPAVLETNRFPDFGGKYYSFPFSKSVLVMYFNRKLLEAAGVPGPPRTWDAFLDACRAVKAKTGKYGYAIAVDCSTVSAMVFSMGGSLLEGHQTSYGQRPALRVFKVLETLIQEDIAYQIPPGTFEDNIALANDDVAFVLRTSASLAPVARLMEGDRERWGVAPIPQADPENPATVLFGPNVTLFDVGTPAQQRTAWAFVKFFTSPEVNVRWALGTGYLPIRRSAKDHPAMQRFWAEWESNRVPFECLEFARPEPNVSGWQEVRDLVERAETAVLSGTQSAEDAARELKRKADRALQRR